MLLPPHVKEPHQQNKHAKYAKLQKCQRNFKGNKCHIGRIIMGRTKKHRSNKGHKKDQNPNYWKRQLEPAQGIEIPEHGTEGLLERQKSKNSIARFTYQINVEKQGLVFLHAQPHNSVQHRKQQKHAKTGELSEVPVTDQ